MEMEKEIEMEMEMEVEMVNNSTFIYLGLHGLILSTDAIDFQVLLSGSRLPCGVW